MFAQNNIERQVYGVLRNFEEVTVHFILSNILYYFQRIGNK